MIRALWPLTPIWHVAYGAGVGLGVGAATATLVLDAPGLVVVLFEVAAGVLEEPGFT